MQTLAEINGKWSSGDVTSNGLRLHYTRTGGEKPPLVLAHGFSDDGLCWAPVAQALEADFDVIMVDARGHGNSEAPEQGYGSVEMAHDLAGVIEEMRLDTPIVLGHSMGAATALTLAGLYPQLPGAILLEDPPAWWKAAPPVETTGDAPVDDSWQQRMRSWIIELQSQSREELIEKQQRAAPSWSPIEVELWADAHLRLSLNVLNGQGIRGAQDLSLYGRISCPALLLTADPTRGAIVTEEDALLLQGLIPQLKVAHIANAGHSIHREQFEPFMDAVRAFLKQVPS